MYVCICQAVTETAIKKAADSGAKTIRDLKRELGLGTGCGKCVLQALQTLKAAQGEVALAEELGQAAQATERPAQPTVATLIEPQETTLERPRLRSALYG